MPNAAWDRRQHPRTAFGRDVDVRFTHWLSLRALGHDLSHGGIKISLPTTVNRGDRLTIGLTLPNELQLALEAEVQNVMGDDRGCVAGLRWLDSKDIEVLQLLIDDLKNPDLVADLMTDSAQTPS